MLELRSVKCVRGDRILFENLSFSVLEGEFLLLNSPNGSGKTSLLRLLCGLMHPSAGDVRWNGCDIRELGEDYNSAFLYLGHRPAVKDELTTVENLRFFCGIREADLAAEQVQAVLEMAGLHGFENHPARLLSDGLRRRLALASLLACRATLWLLDEILTSLDSSAVAWITSVIDAHLAHGGMIVMATHQAVHVSSPVRFLRLPV